MTDRRRRAEELFFRLLDVPAGERAALLAELAPEPEVRDEALELLALDEGAKGPTLSAKDAPPPSAPGADLGENEGAVIGPYTLIRQVGEGGFGAVWLARQSTPVVRDVALKLLKPGVDTRRVLARFEAERQIQARLDHPSVSRVLDAGMTPSGRPYFTMDFVPGVPITSWCDARRLPVRRRVELFCEVCDAVQFAHQKGIVHRDLKPGNLLVQDETSGARVRVLDFGIAKAMREPASDGGQLTFEGQVLGTPDYMSPEQLAGDDDVDTRTDVFALGVLLFELLTGALPWGRTGRSLVSRATEPARPSRAALDPAAGAGAGADTDARAACRDTDARALAKTLGGDLDWINLRALAPERDRRYGTAAELAADLRRYLASEPVLAGPPGRAYRAKKFVRRHRAGVIATAAVGVALVAGVTVAALGWREARRAERVASEEARAAEAVSAYLVDLFGYANPDQTPVRDMTARSILAAGVARVGERLHGEPLTEARMLSAMGEAYDQLGQPEEALPLFERALALRRALLPADDPAITEALLNLGGCQQERGNTAVALELVQEAVRRAEQRTDVSPLLLAEAYNQLAVTLVDADRVKEAVPLHERVLARRIAATGEGDIKVVESLSNLGSAYYFLGEDAKAAATFERAIGIVERYRFERTPQLPYALNNLGAAYVRMGRKEDADRTLTRALAAERAILGPEHFLVAATLQNHADLLETMPGGLARAEALDREALALREKTLGPGHPTVGASLFRLARIAVRQGRTAEARPLLRRAQEVLKSHMGGRSKTMDEVRALLRQIGS